MITRASFVPDLLSAVPEVDVTVREHLDDYEGELLLHLLMADLVTYSVAAFEDGRSGEAQRLLAFVDSCLADGDEDLTNAVLVSFIENYSYGQNERIHSWHSGRMVFVRAGTLAVSIRSCRLQRR